MAIDPRKKQLEPADEQEKEEERLKALWREVLDDGDPDALHQLANTLVRVDDGELGAGD
jgi:hypothetical protein